MQKYGERIAHLLFNSNRFFWGVLPGTQRDVYCWLHDKKHLQFRRGTYNAVTSQLIDKYGIEYLLLDMIVPFITAVFPERTIDNLRHYWQKKGHPPEFVVLQKLETKLPLQYFKFYPGNDNSVIWWPFVKINTLYQKSYVERWGELAGIWFEEIEPWLQNKSLDN
jgi:hypothetical protein